MTRATRDEGNAPRTALPTQLFAIEDGGPRALDVSQDAHGPHDAIRGDVDAVYTGLRTWDGVRFLALDAHLDRIEKSMLLAGWAGGASGLDREGVRRALHAVASGYAEEFGTDAMLRVDVLAPDASYPGTTARVLIAIGPLRLPPAEFYEEGVEVELAPDLHRATPLVKSTDFVTARRPYPLGTRDAYEHLMIDDDERILEGTSSNFYAVLDDTLCTAGDGVLAGITRGIVLRLADEAGIRVDTAGVTIADLERAREAFLSSSTRGIVPIVRVAERTIGDGRPGPRTRELGAALRAYAEANARPAWPA